MTKQRLYAPSHDSAHDTKYPVYELGVTFPVDLDGSDVMDLLQEVCKERGWKPMWCKPDKRFTREMLDAVTRMHEGMDIDPTVFKDFRPAKDEGDPA